MLRYVEAKASHNVYLQEIGPYPNWDVLFQRWE